MPELTVIERRWVPFAGSVSGTGELTWGQQAIWREITEIGYTLNISRVMALPAAMTVEVFTELVGLLMGQNPSLRTRLRLDPDGHPRQVVSPSGDLPVDIVDVPDRDDPEETVRELAWHSILTPFDYENEWPVRTVMARHRGVLTHAAWTFCHLSLGAGSIPLMTAGLGLPGLTEQSAPPAPDRWPAGRPAMNLLELADRESSPAARRNSDAAMRHWEKHLRATPLPAPRGPVPREDYRGARCWHVQTHSPATYLGLQAVAARTQTDTARVLMALYAVALARITRVNPVVTRIVVSNRARPGLADVVGPVSQYGLCTIDVAGITVDEAVARARASVLSAAKYAYYDPSALDDLLVKLGRERDQPAGPPHRGRLHVGLSFNDRRRLGQPTPTDVLSAGSVTAEQLRSAVDEFSMTWDGPLDRYVDQLGIAVDNQPGTIDLNVSVDTHYLAPSELEAFLWELQAVAVEAAVDPATPTGVPYAAGDLDHRELEPS